MYTEFFYVYFCLPVVFVIGGVYQGLGGLSPPHDDFIMD